MEDQQQGGSKHLNRMPYINSTNILDNDEFSLLIGWLENKKVLVWVFLKKKKTNSKYFQVYISLYAVIDKMTFPAKSMENKHIHEDVCKLQIRNKHASRKYQYTNPNRELCYKYYSCRMCLPPYNTDGIEFLFLLCVKKIDNYTDSINKLLW